MYTQFYELREKPFSLTPDPRFLFLSDTHREALAHLLYGIEQGEGFIAVTGEVGTGKTTLCRTLLRRLAPGTEVAFIFNPQLSGGELLEAIAGEFGLPVEGRSKRELHDELNRFLLDKKREDRRVLLLIDEAQTLALDALEQVRLLSNLETETEKLIQIVLVGQPELDAMLESPDLRQLRQRIGVRWRLTPLSASETREYVHHRLRVAAGERRDIFTDMALREVHRATGGIPRLINQLCDRALLAGYANGSTHIDLGLVARVQRELRARGPAPAGGAQPRSAPPWLWRWIPVAALLPLVAFAGWAWWIQRPPAEGASTLPSLPAAVQPAASAGVEPALPTRVEPAAPSRAVPEASRLARTGPESPAPPSPGAAPSLSPGAPAEFRSPAVPPPAVRSTPKPSGMARAPAASERPGAVRTAAPGPDRSEVSGSVGPGEALGAAGIAESAPASQQPTTGRGATTPTAGSSAIDEAARHLVAAVSGWVGAGDAGGLASEEFGGLLARTSPASTVASSLDSLLDAWGTPPEGAGVLSLSQALAALRSRGFAVLELRTATAASLRAIDQPALLILPALDGAQRAAVLRQLGPGEQAEIHGLTAQPLRVPFSAVEPHWRGEAYVVWRDFEALPPVIRPGIRGAPVEWLQQGLSRLGLYAGPPNGEFDSATIGAVRTLQGQRALEVDGTVGPWTKMVLYQSLGGYPIPRLRNAEGAS